MKYILDQQKKHQFYFEKICSIPHGSFHEQAISNFLMEFAKEHHLKARQDKNYNVVIFKNASPQYVTHEAIILQAHLDMVCEKDNQTTFDFTKDPLQLYTEEGLLKARGTTLGADDGCGVAYMLAILSDQELKHPPLTCVFTVQEEVGLLGALALNKSDLNASRMINLDDSGEISTCISSAGGMRMNIQRKLQLKKAQNNGYQICIKGLKGGHSGEAIHKERANAIQCMGRILYAIGDIQIASIQAGTKDNAIPREASVLFTSLLDFQQINEIVSQFRDIFKHEFIVSEPDLQLTCTQQSTSVVSDLQSAHDLIRLLILLPNGLRHRSMEIKNLSTASSNMGILEMGEDTFNLIISLRGSLESYLERYANEIEELAKLTHCSATKHEHYPAWSYSKNSKMREVLNATCLQLYQKEIKQEAVHGGLECGVFKAENNEMDIVSMGPIMYDIHTPQEALDLASFDRTYHFLTMFLKAL